MTLSYTTSPSISQGARLNFQDSFFALAQQTDSQLVSSKAIKMAPSSGKTTNFARIGRIELDEVNTRNPDKQYGDYALDNRLFTKRRFTKTIQIDKKYDINELLADPTSDILQQLNNAKERVIDRVAIAAAVGNVLVGGPDTTPSSISAATDGVVTIDGTGGFTYEIVQAITAQFINSDLPYSLFRGSTVCLTGNENSDLMGEDQFINQDYMIATPNDVAGVAQSLGKTYMVAMFAGSSTGGGTVAQPVLPEGATTRSCVVLAPQSILMAMEIGDMGVEKSAQKVNSVDITIDLWINAMRTEGPRVIIVTTTI
jgi:hypothetical protein